MAHSESELAGAESKCVAGRVVGRVVVWVVDEFSSYGTILSCKGRSLEHVPWPNAFRSEKRHPMYCFSGGFPKSTESIYVWNFFRVMSVEFRNDSF